jgi:hypothetical protein
MLMGGGNVSRAEIGHGWVTPEVVEGMKAEEYEYLYEDSLKENK